MDHGIIYILLACVFGAFMTWGVGANDLANVMSTTMGSKAVTVKQAITIAIIFEFAGAFFGGTGVTETMRDGIINIDLIAHDPDILIYGMLSVLLAGMVWMNLTSYLGMPVSITNAIVGSVVGFGVVVLGVNAIHWKQVGFIAASWVSSPIIAGILAYIIFTVIQRTILATKNPIESAKRYMPFYLFLVGIILSIITILKGIAHFGFDLKQADDITIILISSILVTISGLLIIKRIPTKAYMKRRERFAYVEKMFGVLMAFTACAMVFAHGSNDVAVAVGPITVVTSLVHPEHGLMGNGSYPNWIILLGASGVVAGLIFHGRKVIETVGSGITALTPSRAFAATIAAATAVIVSTSNGIPVSATQTLVGGVLGVGLARGIGALNMVVIRNIFTSWIVTLPAASLLTILFYNGFRLLLG